MRVHSSIAGLVASGIFSVMAIVFARMGVLVLIPILLGALPVYIAALGWGAQAGMTATLGIIVFISIVVDPTSGILISMMVAVPAVLAGYQINLAQPSKKQAGKLQWYPLSLILFWTALLVAGGVLTFGLVLDFDPSALAPQITQHFQSLLSSINSDVTLSQEEIIKTVTLNLQMLPFVLPSLWVAIHVLNLLLGIVITRRMAVLARPHEDIAGAFNLPQSALVIMAVSLAGMTIIAPPLRYAFMTVAGSMMMAFSIVGLAIMHQHIRNWAEYKLVLLVIYAIIALVFFPVYLFSLAGFWKAAHGKPSVQKDNPNGR